MEVIMYFSLSNRRFISRLLLLSFCFQLSLAMNDKVPLFQPITTDPSAMTEFPPLHLLVNEIAKENKTLMMLFIPGDLPKEAIKEQIKNSTIDKCLFVQIHTINQNNNLITTLRPFLFFNGDSPDANFVEWGNKQILAFDPNNNGLFKISNFSKEDLSKIGSSNNIKVCMNLLKTKASGFLNAAQRNLLTLLQEIKKHKKETILVGTIILTTAGCIFLYRYCKKNTSKKNEPQPVRPSIDSLHDASLDKAANVRTCPSVEEFLQIEGDDVTANSNLIAFQTRENANPEYEGDPYYYHRKNPEVELMDPNLVRDPNLNPNCIITEEHLFGSEQPKFFLNDSSINHVEGVLFNELDYPSETERIPLENKIAGEIPAQILQLVNQLNINQKNQKGSGTLTLKGPSGTGKTHMAAAIAKATGRNFMPFSATSFGSKWINSLVEGIKMLFEKAYEEQQQKPIVLFIDEIDGVGFARDSESMDKDGNDKTIAGNSEYIRALEELILQIDHCLSKYPKILIVVATNRFNMLDNALQRRLEANGKVVEMALPNETDRKAILEFYASNQSAKYPSGCFAKIARWTNGFSCDHMKNIVQCALDLAYSEAEQNGLRVDIKEEHFMKAYETIKQNRQHSKKSYSWKSEISHIMTAVGLGIQLYSTYSSNRNHASSSKQQEGFHNDNYRLGLDSYYMQQDFHKENMEFQKASIERAEWRQDQAEERQKKFQRELQDDNHRFQLAYGEIGRWLSGLNYLLTTMSYAGSFVGWVSTKFSK